MCLLIASPLSLIPGPIDLLVFGSLPVCLAAILARRDAKNEIYSLHSAFAAAVASALAFLFLTSVMDGNLAFGAFVGVMAGLTGLVPAFLAYLIAHRFYKWHAKTNENDR